MAEEQTGVGDDEPTRVTGSSDDEELPPKTSPAPPVGTEGEAPPIESIDRPVGGRPEPASEAGRAATAGTGPAAADPTAAGPAGTGPDPVAPDPAIGGSAGAGEPAEGSARARGRAAADRTAEGAKFAADRVSHAASATAQALRETDVHEIARSTTSLIETARPFFLAAFAIVFTFLASVENHAAIGVVFAVGAILCVLGAAYSAAVDHILKGRGTDDA